MSLEAALIGVGSALAAVWLLAVVGLVRAGRGNHSPADVARLISDLARLLTRLVRDRTIPLHVRARIAIAIAYNVQPINLIPDFVPVVGLVDNLVVILWALRSTARVAGPDAIVRHWPGTSAGLSLVLHSAGLQQPMLDVRTPSAEAPAE